MVADLREFILQTTGDDYLRVEHDYGGGFVRLLSAEAERRQAKHDIRSSEDIVIELLRNSRDAGARRIFLAAWKEKTTRKLTVVDDGAGLPAGMRELIFEARVTSKLDDMKMDAWGIHGRGMALYAIRENTQAAFVACSKEGGGTSIHVESDTDSLGEKKDQSTPPVFVRDESGTVSVRGPKNIIRTALEFAYVERGACEVYLGSPAEIAATLHAVGDQAGADRSSGNRADEQHDDEEQDVCGRLSHVDRPDNFASIATRMALPMSGRTARRILDGQIRPLDPLSDFLLPDRKEAPKCPDKRPAAPSGENAPQPEAGYARKLKASRKDLDRLEEGIVGAYAPFAQAYYLEEHVQPKISVRTDGIHITIPTIWQD